jgi:hypothetical protein
MKKTETFNNQTIAISQKVAKDGTVTETFKLSGHSFKFIYTQDGEMTLSGCGITMKSEDGMMLTDVNDPAMAWECEENMNAETMTGMLGILPAADFLVACFA